MIEIKNKKDCCGCTSCMNICPKKAIKMVYDEEGFLYPQVDKEKCINCELCEKVCPMLNKNQIKDEIFLSYACQNLNNEIRSKSTSGGLFEVLAKHIFSLNGIVYGVGFDSDMNISHLCAKNEKELNNLIGSKYVQSNLKDIFSDIKIYLQNNKLVMFVGTPCQVAGLLNYIPKKYHEILYTVELVCYGVPSPGIYRKWIDTLEDKYNSKIKYINFREKKYGYAGTNIKIELVNKKNIEDCYDAKSYLKTMFSNIGLRPSCYNCKYRFNNSGSDFTIGDLKDIFKYSLEMDDNKGTTLLKIHTKKGKKLFELICNKIKKIPIVKDDIKIKKEKKVPLIREQFFIDYNIMDYDTLMKKYFPYNKKDFVANVIKPIFIKIPYSKEMIKLIGKIGMKGNKNEKK